MMLSARLLPILLSAGLALAAVPAQAFTVTPIGSGFSNPQGVAVDSNGNVFLPGTNVVFETMGADPLPPLLPVPALGPWALLLCSALLGGTGFVVARRRAG